MAPGGLARARLEKPVLRGGGWCYRPSCGTSFLGWFLWWLRSSVADDRGGRGRGAGSAWEVVRLEGWPQGCVLLPWGCAGARRAEPLSSAQGGADHRMD